MIDQIILIFVGAILGFIFSLGIDEKRKRYEISRIRFAFHTDLQNKMGPVKGWSDLSK